MKVLALFFACAIAPGVLFANEVRDVVIPVENTGAPSSPIQATGQIVFHRQILQDSATTKWQINLKLTNTSSKAILAYEVVVDAMPDVGGGFSHVEQNDYIFNHEVTFRPGAQEDAQGASGATETVPVKAGSAPRTPFAHFSVLFVEFSDGTTFGRSNWGQALHDKRSRSTALLQSFLQAYQGGGDDAFAATVRSADQERGPDMNLQIINRIKYIMDSRGTAAAAAEVRDALDSSAQRKALM